MGAYAYCERCDGSMPGPSGLDTEKLLELLFVGDDAIMLCHSCGPNKGDYFYNHDLIEELAQRIDEGRNKR